MGDGNEYRSDKGRRSKLERRARIIGAIRDFFRRREFLEVETPILVPSPGMEPHLGHFRTALRDKDGRDLPAYLITSPEYAMKRLLAAGHSRVFEITRCFRNDEPWDGSHNPEFTMIEWYRTGVDYRTIMRDTEEMVSEVAIRTVGRADLAYRGKPIDLTPP
ncbi:hypothetical protein AMJ57_02015, partial [Parcubacteria bacterium SG8_24]